MNYKELLLKFLEDENNRKFCVPVVRNLLQANFRGGRYVIKISNKKLEIFPREIEEKIEKVCDFIVEKSLREGYSALVVPFIISQQQAPNFYIFEEEPKEEELWWWLYHLLTGIHYGDYVINLANVPNEIREEFRKYLIQQNFLIFEAERSGIDLNEMLSRLGTPRGIPLKEFILSFIFVSYFAKFWKDCKEKERTAKIMEKIVPEITDDASLLVFVLSRQKKKVYVLPKLKRMLSYWYGDFSDEDSPHISKFIFSFYIADQDHKKESAALLNKFLYYFLQDYVNGELLTKLVELKISYELKKRKKGNIYGLRNADRFFSKL